MKKIYVVHHHETQYGVFSSKKEAETLAKKYQVFLTMFRLKDWKGRLLVKQDGSISDHHEPLFV
tara:strand:+ start:2446 stop:2637 length:192 start_codon:yes stop_codon:yes gene_type:complete